MSLAAGSPSPGLPVRAPALEPAWVRQGSAAVQKQYAAALQFEQMLVAQLAGSLTQNGELGSGSSGEEDGTQSEPGASVFSSMLPQALASGVVSGGGLGLAAELTRELAGTAAGETTQATRDTSAAGQGAAPAPAPSGGIEATTTGGTSA